MCGLASVIGIRRFVKQKPWQNDSRSAIVFGRARCPLFRVAHLVGLRRL